VSVKPTHPTTTKTSSPKTSETTEEAAFMFKFNYQPSKPATPDISYYDGPKLDDQEEDEDEREQDEETTTLRSKSKSTSSRTEKPKPTTPATTTTTRKFRPKLQKLVKTECHLENLEFHMEIDFIQLNDMAGLDLNEDSLSASSVLCSTTHETISIVFKKELALNFTLDHNSNHSSSQNKLFKLNGVEYSDANEKKHRLNNVGEIVAGHMSSIECSNSRQVSTISSIIINLEGYRIETSVRCVRKVGGHLSQILKGLFFLFFFLREEVL
jgi:hypothetical protein